MNQRRAVLWATALLLLASGSAAATDTDSLHQDLGPVPPFALTERGGKTIRADDLLGKVWIASFVFTRCAGGCGQITDNLALLQQRLAAYPDIVLVSFSVDPEHDTPEVLSAYANQKGADPERWLFLTGDEKTLYPLIEKGFFQSVAKVPEGKPGFEVQHTFRLVVIDHRGRIKGYINDARTTEEFPALERRVKLLVQAKYLPSINASLNASSALLLVVGYLAVRRRWLTFHKMCMLAALAVSTLFLASYLYYHFIVLRGQPTGFQGTGPLRPIYFTVLISHTLLAVVAAPLALVTTYLGLRDRLARHVRLARWTLPIWLYVSCTGVVVYWMLYHLDQ